MNNKKVYVAYTGGTIGMKPSSKGFIPEPDYFYEQVSKLPEILSKEIPQFEIHEYSNLIDSSNINPEDWYRISQDIKLHYDDYDGFVVLHGTDTMAYTASALSFMLEDLSKPVIVTGSQIPISQVRSDARDNLITSLILAANYDIPEVGLFFHNKLYRGNRTRKLDATGFHAFQSPNFPVLVNVGTDIKVHHELILKDPEKTLKIQKIKPPKVVMLTLFPGFPATMIKSLLDSDIQGLVLMTYGIGNAPSNDKFLLKLLKQACDAGIIIVNCTQCNKGAVNMHSYETGQTLLETGIINGFDMTPEATLTKLSYLLSCDYTVSEIKQKMQQNLRGELSQ